MSQSADNVGRFYWSTRRVSWPLRRLWLDVTIENPENVPDHAGVVLAANHLSFLDSPLLMYSLPRRVTFLGKAEYLKHWTTRLLFPAAGMIPVDRSGKGLAASLDAAATRLRSGEIVGIFPEGTRSRNGRLRRGHSGAAHLALKTNSPIVPVGIVGTDVAQPPGARFPRRRAAITIRFGAPIGPGPYRNGRPTSSAKRALTAEVMAGIAALSGQICEDTFAPIPQAVPAF